MTTNPTNEPEKGTILVVDDTPANLQLVYAHLRNSSFRVLVAEDGLSGYESARNSKPDIILLDIMMPGMNGFSCCEMLKQDAETRDIPVIFMTALTDTTQKVRGFELGAVDYVTKPVQLAELMARVETHIHLRRLQHYLSDQSQDLREKNAELEKQYKELNTFAHCMTADLKNPLNAMNGFIKVLAKDPAILNSPQSKHFVDQIGDARARMAHSVEMLLLLARISVQQPPVEKLNMTVVLASVRGTIIPPLEARKGRLHVPGNWPAAMGNPEWVQILWEIFIRNAIRYGGNPPEVTLGAEACPDERLVQFWVRDNGPGLSVEEQSRLGDGRVDLLMGSDGPDFARIKEGYGLELSVAERIADKLGGYAGLDSIKGKGSTFSFTLPAA